MICETNKFPLSSKHTYLYIYSNTLICMYIWKYKSIFGKPKINLIAKLNKLKQNASTKILNRLILEEAFSHTFWERDFEKCEFLSVSRIILLRT